MLITLIFWFCIGRIIHADGIATSISTSAATSANLSSAHEPPSTSPPLLFVIDDELTKLAASCITPLEHEQLSGDLIRHLHARGFNHHLITEAADIIASTEMRAALGFAPPGPWTNYRKPSADELTSSLTMEEYFDLRERSKDRSLDSEQLS
ncbi:unnamed protein product [Caenorhabditis auriculariae]|uniref:Uncharacterized protein n=1 Tax=Caenorhabditis auriculariae TaxID=2777116 RepID=A0A8S1HV12_9PELO|nr:unnamed protein product [Caenorhabditis auriculariae]